MQIQTNPSWTANSGSSFLSPSIGQNCTVQNVIEREDMSGWARSEPNYIYLLIYNSLSLQTSTQCMLSCLRTNASWHVALRPPHPPLPLPQIMLVELPLTQPLLHHKRRLSWPVGLTWWCALHRSVLFIRANNALLMEAQTCKTMEYYMSNNAGTPERNRFFCCCWCAAILRGIKRVWINVESWINVHFKYLARAMLWQLQTQLLQHLLSSHVGCPPSCMTDRWATFATVHWVVG